MLIVSQMRNEALNARDLNKIRIENVDVDGIQLPAIVAYGWDCDDSRHVLGTYDCDEAAKDSLTDLALSWESVKCYFME